jgi:hypothetical protein
VSARGEISHHRGGDLVRGSTATQPRGQLGAGPGAPGQEIGGRSAGRRDVEGAPRAYDSRRA